ncbi:MAG: hypothetical protein ABF326_01155 [Arenicellales bacterium]|jgi:hypothetical protein
MNLSAMTKTELINLVQQLQFSLKESHKVIQQLTRDLPAYRKAVDAKTRDNTDVRKRLSLKQELEKHSLFKLYDDIVAADIFNGVDATTSKENALDTIVEVLAIEGVEITRDSLYKYFPSDTKS